MTIVVCRHPDDGFEALPQTLRSVKRLNDGLPLVSRVVVVVTAQDEPAAASKLWHTAGLEMICVSTCAQLTEIMASEPDNFIQFLVSGDRLDQRYAVLVASKSLADCDLVLTDMYFQEGDEIGLVLMPGINRIHALNVDYFLSRVIVRARVAARVMAHAPSLDVYALVIDALYASVADEPVVARHVAFPLIRIAETRSALDERRMQVLARTAPLRLTPAVDNAGGVRTGHRASVVICTKDNGFLLEQLVARLWRDHADELADVVVVSNRTTNLYALMIQARLADAGRIKLIEYDAPFNFSAQCNLGAAAGEGDVLLFLNDDIAPISKEWLSELVKPLENPAVGVVGPLLLYPDQSIQHAGMFLGFRGVAGHTLRGAQLPAGDCGFLASAPRQVMAVTGAALCIRRADFAALNGFDRNLFALYIQDLDLCLRVHCSGLAVVFNPRSVLLHMESISVNSTLADPRMARCRVLEHQAFVKRWGHVLRADEFHNLNFSRDEENLRTLSPFPTDECRTATPLLQSEV
jgi:GT2 family glycosyltransferase